ncbi:MAG: NAD-dependent epimerase/dehydratase family protein [Paracoccaceae bacterium]
MKIVITGGLGFIGRNLARYIRKHDETSQLLCVDWDTEAEEADHNLFDVSITDCFASPDAVFLYKDADVVVHLAATTTVQESIADPATSFENNVVKTQFLLDQLLEIAPKSYFVFASTGGAIIGDFDGPIHENIAARPVSPYGATKLAVEGLLSAYSSSYGMPTASMRFSNVYGPNSEKKSSVVATYCKSIIQEEALKVFGDGTQTRDFVYVDDICNAIWRAIQKRATGTFQLGTGTGTSISKLIDVFKGHLKTDALNVEFHDSLLGEVKHNICNIDHAQNSFGYVPEFDLPRGLDRTLRWFHEHSTA